VLPTPAPETAALPILAYHRIASVTDGAQRRWRVTPEEFDRQLAFLRSAGFRSASWAEWHVAAQRRRPLPGRRVLLTFDDGYQDFADHAVPALERHGFTATVFVVTDRVGGDNGWDADVGAEPVPLMDWSTIRALDARGVTFGGHTATHPMLTALSHAEVVGEASRCRAALVDALGHPVQAFAYPYGDVDPAVASLVGACGWGYGVTAAASRVERWVPMLHLPRLEGPGGMDFAGFVRLVA
jgi:peptidoglycan/xylan/chitin deacetylase (PgdA/CDA1 family)